MRYAYRLVLLLSLTSLGVCQQASLHGIDVTDLDRKADPCNDFYQFANGSWRANNPIPASLNRWSKRWQAGDTTKDKLRDILVAASDDKSAARGSDKQVIGTFYAACMDESRINAAGAQPVQPWLSRIDDAKDMTSLQTVMFDLSDIGVSVPFNLSGSQDPHNPSWIMADISATGLGLPERDYYLKPDPRFAEARTKYKEHIVATFKLAGMDAGDAQKAADTILAMETKMAEASLSPADARDPAASDHNLKFAQLQTMAPNIAWAAYFEHKQVPQDVDLNLQEPKYIKEINGQFEQASLADWKSYLKWHLLSWASPYLSDAFVQEEFAFNGQYLSGAKELKPRWKRCVETTDQLFGDALGKEYAAKYFPPAAKARMESLVQNLLAAMKEDIQSRPWMSAETKQKALEKLSTFNPKIGYPRKWKDYSHVDVTADGYFADVVAGSRFVVEDDRKTIGKAVDRDRWGITVPTSDAYYNPLLNEIVFPAGILQPPAFSLDATDAVNYGAIGVVIGHEISHGFDDQGAQYDSKGYLKNWWTEADLKQFQGRGACVADQFDHYEIESGLHENGKLVEGESIGDLGGAKIAFLAYQKSLEGKPRPADVDGFTPEQQFFIAWGQFRGDETRIEQQRLMVQVDPHPVAKYRVNGPLSNLPEFQEAFHCKAGSAMVRPADKRCDVW